MTVTPTCPTAPPAAGDPLAAATNSLAELREQLVRPDAAIDRQHHKGKLHARERLALLLDPGSFSEIDPFRRHVAFGAGLDDRRPAGDGVITGFGRIDGRQVFVFAHDFTVFGGTLGATFARKICKIMDMALAARAPVIGINDGAGARIQEGVDALAGYGELFRRNVAASGVIPQISVLAGPCAGGAAYSPALTDFVFMVDELATAFITGPDVIRAVTGEQVDAQHLGGSQVHATRTGVAHFTAPDEASCLESVRRLLSYLPSSHAGGSPVHPALDDPFRRCDGIAGLVPGNRRQAYDVRPVIETVLDDQSWYEVAARWAPNVITGFGRLAGHAIGVVANQPLRKAGVLDIHSSEKAARFVRFCDAFSIPLVTFVDTPGFMPGSDQEYGGVIRRGAKLLYAYCEASVPRLSVVLRKAYGGAYIVMDSRSVGSDLALAWPANEIAVMGAEGAVDVIHRRAIASAGDPAACRDELIESYRAHSMHPFMAAERGHIDDVIDPADTRRRLAEGLAALRGKQASPIGRRHGNVPL